MIAYWTIRWRLMAVPGVANVAIWGERWKQLPAAVRPGEAAGAPGHARPAQSVTSDALDFGLLQVHDAATNGIGRVHRHAATSGSASTTSCPIFTPEDLAKVAVHDRQGRRHAARARRRRHDDVGPPAAVRRRGHQRRPGPHARGREVPVGEHARRDPRRRRGARGDAARPARHQDRHPHLPAGDVHRASSISQPHRRAAPRRAARRPRAGRLPVRVADGADQPGRHPALADGRGARARTARRRRSTRWCWPAS